MCCVWRLPLPWLRSTQTHAEIFCVATGASGTGDSFLSSDIICWSWSGTGLLVCRPCSQLLRCTVISSPRFPCCGDPPKGASGGVFLLGTQVRGEVKRGRLH